MPSGLGPTHLFVVLLVALIVLGPERLPHAARQVGRAMGELRRWTATVESEVREAIDSHLGETSQPEASAWASPANGEAVTTDRGVPSARPRDVDMARRNNDSWWW